MADIELVIKVDEKIYQEALKSGYSHLYDEEVANAVANGTPLPKGHGKLIDVDDLTWARHTVNKYGYEEDIVVSWDDIVDAPTIIEADKEGDEE